MTNRTRVRRLEGVLPESPVVGAVLLAIAAINWVFIGGAVLAAVIGLAPVVRRTGSGRGAGVSDE